MHKLDERQHTVFDELGHECGSQAPRITPAGQNGENLGECMCVEFVPTGREHAVAFDMPWLVGIK